MRSNKLEPIQNLTEIKPLKPLPSLSPLGELQKGAIVSAIGILWLNAHVLYETQMLLKKNLSDGELRRRFDRNMLIVKELFRLDREQGYMMKKEFEELRKAAGVKERLSK